MLVETKSKVSLSKIVLIVAFSILSGLAGYASAKTWYGSQSIFMGGNPITQVGSFLFDGKNLIGENKGQVNVLLLGIGGQGHDGPYLSDTIMVASIKPQTSEISLTSIPRDTSITLSGGSAQYKINHVYAFAVAKHGQKDGLIETQKTIGNFLGMDIPYAVVVDFEGFVKAVDSFGGVPIQIDKTFTDSRYPNDRNGYIPPVTFKEGIEHMDGKRALIYARSRHSTSDYDRAKRQQRVIEAFTARSKELNIFKDIGTINKLFDTFTAHVWTNMDAGEIRRLAHLGTSVPQSKTYSTVIDPNTGMVCSYLSSARGYHLNICPGKTNQDLWKFVETAFARGRSQHENSAVEIQNATSSSGLAIAAASQLKSIGMSTSAASAGKLSDSRQTIVYDLTDGKKPETLNVLLSTFSATKGTTPPLAKGTTQPDFIVVLGSNYRAPMLDTINLDPPPPPKKTEDEDGEETPAEDEDPVGDPKKTTPKTETPTDGSTDEQTTKPPVTSSSTGEPAPTAPNSAQPGSTINDGAILP